MTRPDKYTDAPAEHTYPPSENTAVSASSGGDTAFQPPIVHVFGTDPAAGGISTGKKIAAGLGASAVALGVGLGVPAGLGKFSSPRAIPLEGSILVDPRQIIHMAST
jgi:hypothetical protein